MVQRCLDALGSDMAAVAIIPAGTANLLAKNLGIPKDISSSRPDRPARCQEEPRHRRDQRRTLRRDGRRGDRRDDDPRRGLGPQGSRWQGGLHRDRGETPARSADADGRQGRRCPLVQREGELCALRQRRQGAGRHDGLPGCAARRRRVGGRRRDGERRRGVGSGARANDARGSGWITLRPYGIGNLVRYPTRTEGPVRGGRGRSPADETTPDLDRPGIGFDLRTRERRNHERRERRARNVEPFWR